MGAAAPVVSNTKKLPEPEINVTPLVDVVLVLLIIFMVIAPALEHGERVELPAIVKPDPKNAVKAEPLTLTLTAGRKVFLEKEAIDRDDLRARLVALHQQDPDKRVVLKGDSGLPYAEVRAIFALVERTGFNACSLMVSKRGNET